MGLEQGGDAQNSVRVEAGLVKKLVPLAGEKPSWL